MRILSSLAILLLFTAVSALAADDIPKGTKIDVRITTLLNSETTTPGDTFEAKLNRDLVVNGKTIAPEGSIARGHVDTADPSNGGQTAGVLIIRLTEIETKDAIYNFTTSTYTRQGHGRTRPYNRGATVADTIAGIGHPTAGPPDIGVGTTVGSGSGPAALISEGTLVTFRTTTAAKTENK